MLKRITGCIKLLLYTDFRDLREVIIITENLDCTSIPVQLSYSWITTEIVTITNFCDFVLIFHGNILKKNFSHRSKEHVRMYMYEYHGGF